MEVIEKVEEQISNEISQRNGNIVLSCFKVTLIVGLIECVLCCEIQ